MGDVTSDAHGRVVTDPDEDARARTLVFDKYQPRNDGELVTWRARALPVALDLDLITGCAVDRRSRPVTQPARQEGRAGQS